MEPTLPGPQVVGNCIECSYGFVFAEEIAIRTNPLRCPRCDYILSGTEHYKRRSGLSVDVELIEPKSNLRRGDLIVFEGLQRQRVVKRLVGFPGESIRISDGDLFVDNLRYQKTISDFYRSSIRVSSWSDANEYCAKALPSKAWCVYESSSLWPRVGQRASRHASPILDELAVNPDEPFPFVPVQDIGLVLSLENRPVNEFDLIIGVWSTGALRTVYCRFRKADCIVSPGSLFDRDSGVTIRYDSMTENQPSNETRFVMAIVDGRVGAAVLSKSGVSIGSQYWQTYECLDSGNVLQDANCSAERPVVISLPVVSQLVSSTLGSRPCFGSVEIIRDIHYRGPHGEHEYKFPVVRGYHVLGDNVSIAADSRSEFAEGIERSSVSGRIIPCP